MMDELFDEEYLRAQYERSVRRRYWRSARNENMFLGAKKATLI